MSMMLTDTQITAIKRKRGELNLSIAGLSHQVGLSRWTLYNIFKDGHRKVTPATYKKLNDWLINEYVSADITDSKQAVLKN